MTRFVQLHLLTFVPPANLNRDDTGRPKTAVIGGETRLRLSSQSLKRAWRTSDVFHTQLDGLLSLRTRQFGEIIRAHLLDRGIDADKALKVTRALITAFGKPKAEADKHADWTEQLAFLSPAEQAAALDLAVELAESGEKTDGKLASRVLKGADTAVDIALFGRMFADNPDFNREAAAQVAHAFTTHPVTVEDDFYTAVDDLNTRNNDAGAGFMGDAGFGSGVFYQYLCVDVGLLTSNLGGDSDLARRAVAALLEAAMTVMPSGKRASFASHVRASYALAEKGSAQPRSLAEAFSTGVRGTEVLASSITRLKDKRDGFDRVYGRGDVVDCEVNVASEGGGTLADLIAFATDWSH